MLMVFISPYSFFFFFNDTATTEIYTLSLHDALPIFFHHHLYRLCLAPVKEFYHGEDGAADYVLEDGTHGKEPWVNHHVHPYGAEDGDVVGFLGNHYGLPGVLLFGQEAGEDIGLLVLCGPHKEVYCLGRDLIEDFCLCGVPVEYGGLREPGSGQVCLVLIWFYEDYHLDPLFQQLG